MKQLTKIGYNTNKSDSLKTTIPSEVVEKLELNKGDTLIWICDEGNVCIKKLDL